MTRLIIFETKNILIVGDNHINDHIFNNFKRFSTYRPFTIKNLKELNTKYNYDYIIDCSFDINIQDSIIDYSKNNKTKKVVILSNYKRDLIHIQNLVISQLIITDLYFDEHKSFNRSGFGNDMEFGISYCDFICESLRRIHESKMDLIPNLYINYSTNMIKYIHIDSLYKSIDHVIKNIDNNCYYEIYDEVIEAGQILNMLKEIIDYRGNIVFNYNEKSLNNQNIKRLNLRYKPKSINTSLKNIYNNLIRNNDRFKLLVY